MAGLDDLVGESPPMAALRGNLARLLERISALQRLPPILIRGETGTGKTMLARLIHQASARAKNPFVEINCAAFQETLLESQLFGRARHAYTEAGSGGPGLFQTANRGVLFLDEIGDMSLALQAKVLTAIADGTVRRVGSNETERVDVAIVAATNVDLEAAMRERRFREDLYGRIAGITLEIPPLRAREADVELLAERFLVRECEKYGLPPRSLTAAARAALRGYSWRHNVRELELLIGKIVVMGDSSPVTAEELGLPRAAPALHDANDLARQELLDAWSRTNGNISRTADELGISRNAVKRRLERWLPHLRTGPRPLTAAPSVAPPSVTTAESAPVAVGQARTLTPAEPATAAPSDARLTHEPTGLRWERRRVTLMRVTLRGESTTSLAVASRSLDQLVERVRSFAGRVEELSPQGLLAVFGMEPDEGAPRRGANAALAIVKTAASKRADGVLPTGLSVSVAIHVARLLLASVGGTVILDEDGKKEAWSRIDELAAGSDEGIALTDEAAVFLGRQFEIVRRAEGGRVAFRLLGRAAADRTLISTEFVGRQAELMLLRGLLERAREGHGQLVSIIGEPGIGKSRLVREFVLSLRPDAITVLTGQCVSDGATAPYYLVLDVLRDVCGIEETDRFDAIETKARGVLDRLGVGEATWTPYVLNLLHPGAHPAVAGATPETVKERTFEALQHLMLAQQERQPLVVVVEDLHWIDRTSEELLGALADIVGGGRVLVVCTARPGVKLPWAGRLHASQIALAPLPIEASRRLVESLPTGSPVKPDVVAAILTRAEGNPFFLEELMRALRDEDEPADLRVPETVHEVLATRLLRLRDADRRLLQTAAVIGRDLPLALLEAVCEPSAEPLSVSLARLQTAEFLHPKRLGPEAVNAFNHALTWEVVYDSVPDDERRLLHARVGEAIERRYPDTQGDAVRQLAYHAVRAQQWLRALTYLRRAGTRAIDQAAHREAIACFEQCLAVLGHLPETRETIEQAIDLRFDLRNALQPLGDLGRIVGCLREAETLAVQLGDERRLGWVASYLTEHYRMLGEPALAIEAGRRALEIGERLDDLAMRVITNLPLGLLHRTLGDYRRATTFLRWNTEHLHGDLLYERFGLFGHPSVFSRAFVALCLAELGEFPEAAAIGLEGVTLAETIDQPSSRVYANIGAGVVSLRKGDWPGALPRLHACVAVARSANIPVGLVYGASFLGYALALSGRLDEGLRVLEEAVQQAEAMKLVSGHSLSLACLGEAHLLTGRLERAAATAERAQALALEHGERGNEAYARRLVADVAAARDQLAAAGKQYVGALAVAEELGMRPLSAHCHWGLGRVLRRQGQAGTADEHVSRAAALFDELRMSYWRARLDEDGTQPG
jgi:transcriptional regulator with AAA-type ATPase domain/tetratricopeptide (TPR) repeat protein